MPLLKIEFVGTLGPRPGGAEAAGPSETSHQTDDVKRSTGEIFATAPGHEKAFGALVSIEGGPTIALDYGPDMKGVKADVVVLSSLSPHSAGGLTEGVGMPVYGGPGTAAVLPEGLAKIVKEVQRTLKGDGYRIVFHKVKGSMRIPWHAVEIEMGGARLLYAPRLFDFVSNKSSVLRRINIYVGDLTNLDRDVRRNLGGQVIGHAAAAKQVQWAKVNGVAAVVFTNVGQGVIKAGHDETMKVLQRMAGTNGLPVRIATDGAVYSFSVDPAAPEKEKVSMEMTGPTIGRWDPSCLNDEELAQDWAVLSHWWGESKRGASGLATRDSMLVAAELGVEEFGVRTYLAMPATEGSEDLVAKSMLRIAGAPIYLPASIRQAMSTTLVTPDGVDAELPHAIIDEASVAARMVMLGPVQRMEPAALASVVAEDVIAEIEKAWPGQKDYAVQSVRGSVTLATPQKMVARPMVVLEGAGPVEVKFFQAKIPKEEVQFSDAADPDSRSCGTCRYFLMASGECAKVKGYADARQCCDIYDGPDGKSTGDLAARINHLQVAARGMHDGDEMERIYPVQGLVQMMDKSGMRSSRPIDEMLAILRRKGMTQAEPVGGE